MATKMDSCWIGIEAEVGVWKEAIEWVGVGIGIEIAIQTRIFPVSLMALEMRCLDGDTCCLKRVTRSRLAQKRLHHVKMESEVELLLFLTPRRQY